MAASRGRLHTSVFGRLLVVMVAMALTLVVIVSVFFAQIVGPGLGRSMRDLVREYGRLVAATSPDLAAARRITERLDVQVRYEGPRGAWSTADDLPTVAEARSGAGAAGRDTSVVEAPDGGAYVFAWGHTRRMRTAHDRLLVLTLALMIGVVVTAHLVIRRSLRPLRTLHDGVTRLGEGELDVVLPPPATGDEFGAVIEAFNRMAARVREMVAARDQLLVDVSHELRSPLTRMKVALALLPDGEKQRRMSADVAEMEAMLAELLEHERLRDGRAVRPVRQDLAPLLREAAEPFAGGSPGVTLDTAGGPLPVDVDAGQLRTVLRNLLENAVKYALPDSRPVVVSASREAARVVVRVTDDGPGIPEDDLARVFEPFFRVDRSRSRRTGGYGLGLAICRRIVEAHGGSLVAERNAAPARGVSMVLTLPATPGP